MENKFKELGIEAEIVKSLDLLEFTTPTPVQEQAIPRVLDGKDLVVISKTGSGKTGAFGIPMLQLLEKRDGGAQALILTPTRELAVQVDRDIHAMSKFKDIRTTTVYGQHSMTTELDALEKGVEIITGTPGRVLDHLKQGSLITKQIRFLVLDEADRMLDMGFIDQVQRIINQLPKARVTMLFSATMPAEIQSLCQRYMRDPMTIELESDTKTVDSIEQTYYKVEHNEKRKQLYRILCVEQPKSCMVFCNTRVAADRVDEFLNSKGFASKAIHGANSQSSRLRAIDQFKKGGFQILCATDVAARGIHVEDLTMVINYDVPQEKDSYVHRIGRTGRAGHGGRALTLVTRDDLYTLYEIEEHVGALIEERELPTDAEFEAADKPKPAPRAGERRKRETVVKKRKETQKKESLGGGQSKRSRPPRREEIREESVRRDDKTRKTASKSKTQQPPKVQSKPQPKQQVRPAEPVATTEPIYRKRVVIGGTQTQSVSEPERKIQPETKPKGVLQKIQSLFKK